MMTTQPAVTVSCRTGQGTHSIVAEAAAMVRRGRLVVFPTETVYGIAAHAWDVDAIQRLQQVKDRPSDKPFTIHLWDVRQVHVFAREVSALTQRIMKQFWPGPLTLVLPGRETPTVGLRLPAHPVALTFLQQCRVPVAAPSANGAAAAPPTTAAQAAAAVGSQVDLVLDGGPTTYQGPSTVLEVTGDWAHVHREGVISIKTLQQKGIPLI